MKPQRELIQCEEKQQQQNAVSPLSSKNMKPRETCKGDHKNKPLAVISNVIKIMQTHDWYEMI